MIHINRLLHEIDATRAAIGLDNWASREAGVRPGFDGVTALIGFAIVAFVTLGIMALFFA